MDWQLAFSADGSRLTLTIKGVAQMEGFIACCQEAGRDSRWQSNVSVVLDLRDLDMAALDQGDILHLVEVHKPHATRLANNRIAVLVSRPVAYGLVRMWMGFTQDLEHAHGVFYRMEEAETWLRGAK